MKLHGYGAWVMDGSKKSSGIDLQPSTWWLTPPMNGISPLWRIHRGYVHQLQDDPPEDWRLRIRSWSRNWKRSRKRRMPPRVLPALVEMNEMVVSITFGKNHSNGDMIISNTNSTIVETKLGKLEILTTIIWLYDIWLKICMLKWGPNLLQESTGGATWSGKEEMLGTALAIRIRIRWGCYGCYMGLSENSVPLHPMVNDHYPY